MDNLGKSKSKYPHGGLKNIGNRKLKRNKVLLILFEFIFIWRHLPSSFSLQIL